MANQRTGTFKDPVTFGRWRLSAVTDLTPDPRNPRKHRPAQVQAIARSIEAFGFNAPVLIDKNGRILAGHGRYEAALLLGLSQIPVISLEHLSEAQAQGYMLADNRLTDRSVWDDKIVALHLKELADRALDFDIEAVGFEKPEIDLRIQSLDMTPVDAADDFEFASEPVVSMGLLCEKNGDDSWSRSQAIDRPDRAEIARWSRS
jgi:ParB-like chromosome segregation protein Spo0J